MHAGQDNYCYNNFMVWNITVFKDARGADILNGFIQKLDKQTAAKIARLIGVLGQQGPFLHMPYSKKITNDIYELRIRGKQEIRIFYTFKRNTIYLLHIFQKKTQKIPTYEIEVAQKRLKYLT